MNLYMKKNMKKDYSWVRRYHQLQGQYSPINKLINMEMYGFFVKRSDLYFKSTKDEVFLRCDDSLYNIDFGRRFPFIMVDYDKIKKLKKTYRSR